MSWEGAEELGDSFRNVRKNTLIIAEEIPGGKYGYRAAPELRSVRELLAHISNIGSMAERIHGTERRTTLEGFDFPAFMMQALAKEKQPRSKAATIDMLRADGERFAKWLDSLTEEILSERVAFPAGMTPPSKTRFEMLLGVKEHGMHHRCRPMLIGRMLGIVSQ